MRKIHFSMALVLCFVTLGCQGAIKNEVKAYIEAREDLIMQMGKPIEANPTNAGVDEARKIFEAKRADLKQKQEELFKKDIPFDLVQVLMNSSASCHSILDGIGNKLSDGEAIINYSKLRNEFTQAFLK